MAIDTILLCFCEDCEMNDGTPQCAPPLLMNAIGMSSVFKKQQAAAAEEAAAMAAGGPLIKSGHASAAGAPAVPPSPHSTHRKQQAQHGQFLVS
jgi:hypothetical protein